MNPKALSKPVVNPLDLEQLLAMRETAKGLKDRLSLLDEAIGGLEEKIVASIDAGADLSRLPHAVNIQTSERRYPAWKEHFISRLGKEEADAVLENTAPVVYRKLVIK